MDGGGEFGGEWIHVYIWLSPFAETITRLLICWIPIWQIDEETMETVTDFSWAPKSLQMVTAAMKLKDACSLDEKLRQT